ncbi:MAG TPA: anti-sigma factor [Variovorax sp.]|nr:anti-sigma factor [Variovorax sp.]
MIELENPEERDALAAEFVLGTLSEEDDAAFASAVAEDRALQAAVYAWQDRLLALAARVPPASPEPVLWQRIELAVNAATLPDPPAPAPRPWWERLPIWQGLSAAAFSAAVLFGVLLVQRPEAPLAGARYVAVLHSPDGQRAGWVVELDADRLRLAPTGETGPVPAGRSLQFWTKPQDAQGPTSLGLVRAGQALELPLSRLPGVGPQQLFEITLEPEGGSTIGRPTGPILFVGRSVAL